MKPQQNRRVRMGAFLLGLFLLASPLLPAGAQAAPEPGDEAQTDYRTVLVGSDGDAFRLTGTERLIGYRPDGTRYVFEHENYSGPRMHYRIEVPGEGAWWGYCIEHGLSLPDGEAYLGMNADNDRYFNQLPATARQGILLASLYGRQPGKSVPVQGCNDDDWYWATQVLIWEYQQLLRTGPDALKSNGLVPADYFRATLAGRPAEKCYDYILDRIREHERVPSFTARSDAAYGTYTLQRTGNAGEYTLSLTDSNKTGILLNPGGAPVRISYEGDGAYTFRSDAPGRDMRLVFKRPLTLPSHELLIWGSGTDHQALITGTWDPVSFGMVVKTPGQGSLEVQKTSEDGNIGHIAFRLTGPDLSVIRGQTDENGVWRIDLDPGVYLLEEEPIPGYRPFTPQRVEIAENATVTVQAVNRLERRPIRLVKTDAETGKPVLLAGAVFSIDGKLYETDASGCVSLPEGLPFGRYTAQEIRSPQGYALSHAPISFTIDGNSGSSVELVFPDSPQKGRVRVHKTGHDPDASSKGRDLAGAILVLRAKGEIRTPDGTLRLSSGETAGTLTTGPDGTGAFPPVYPGNYLIVETKAPEGYRLPDEPLASVVVPSDASGRALLDIEVDLFNDALVQLPETGDSGPGLAAGALRVVLLMAAAAMAGIGFQRKHPLG